MPRILIADDQADVLAALSLLLKGERFQIESAASPEGVLRSIDTHEFDVVLIDLNYARDTTSGSEGLDLLSRIRAVDPTLLRCSKVYTFVLRTRCIDALATA